MQKCGYDITDGIIIGGDHSTGQLFDYDTKSSVSPKFAADNDTELMRLAGIWFNEHGGKKTWIKGLELRIFA